MTGKLSGERAEFLARDYARGFPADVGYRVTRVDWGEFHTALTIAERHTQQDGFVHAGVMATMADHTMGYASYTIVPDDRRILTVEYKINFLRPAMGRELVCRARVVRPGARIIPAEAQVFCLDQGAETMVAKALGTMAAVDQARLASRK